MTSPASDQRFTSRLGLIVSVLGIAVGTGNIWRFPRIVAQNGGEGGAGAFLVCDRSVSVLALLRELLHFFEVESCGKCTPCRVGTMQARQILDLRGSGAFEGDLAEMRADAPRRRARRGS